MAFKTITKLFRKDKKDNNKIIDKILHNGKVLIGKKA